MYNEVSVLFIVNSKSQLHLLPQHSFGSLFVLVFLLKMTQTRPLHMAVSSIPKTAAATPGVVSLVPRSGNGKKRKLTLQANKQKRRQMKPTASPIEGSTI
jgi:hypothetical protein